MEYEIKKVMEEVDLLALTQEEYDKLNDFYRQVIGKRFPRLKELGQIYDVQRIIMTDGLSRIEVVVTVEGQTIYNDPAGFHRPIPDDLQNQRTPIQ
jgi:hypothetical protein